MTEMSKRMIEAFEHVESLPQDVQDALAECLMSFDADGVYVLSPEEIAAIEEAEAQIARGEFATDEELEAVCRRYAR